MATNVNAQTREIIAKDLLVAIITSPVKQTHLHHDPEKAAEQVASMYKILLDSMK